MSRMNLDMPRATATSTVDAQTSYSIIVVAAKTRELESQMILLSASGHAVKLQSANAWLRQKTHQQRRDVA